MANIVINGSFDASYAKRISTVNRTYAVDLDDNNTKSWSPSSTTSVSVGGQYPINFGSSYSGLTTLTLAFSIEVSSSYCSSNKYLTFEIWTNNGTVLYSHPTQTVTNGSHNFSFTLDSTALATMRSEGATGLQLSVEARTTAGRTTSSLPSASNYSTGYAISRSHQLWFIINPTDIGANITYINPTVNYYTGSEWKACVPYYHNGTTWVECEAKYHNGSGWQTLTKK